MEKNEKTKTSRYGIRLSDLTQEMVVDIFKIYSEVAGIRFEGELEKSVEQQFNRDYIEQTIKEGRAVDLRLGSILTGHSKLFIDDTYVSGNTEDVLKIRFSSNLIKEDGEKRVLAGEKMREDFQNKINEYLQSKGVAVPLLGYN